MGSNWLNWIIQTAIMAGVGAIAYFLKRTNDSIEKRIELNEKKIEQADSKLEALEEKFSTFKEELPTKYVIRDDFIRAMSNVDTKLDKIYDIVTSHVVRKGGE